MSKFKNILFLFLFIYSNSYGQIIDSLSKNSILKKVIVPTSLIVVGSIISNSDFEQNLQIDLRNKVGNNYENNVIEVMYMEGKDTLGFDTIFNQPKSSTFGKFLPLSDIYSCNNRIYIFDNSSMSKNSFFEVRID